MAAGPAASRLAPATDAGTAGRPELNDRSQRDADPERSAAPLTVAEILRRGAADYVEQYRGGQASPHVQAVLARLSLCRTKALGGRWYGCDGCGYETRIYNSCGDRHCPQCNGAKRFDWSDKAETYLLGGVDYFQVVFTLPKQLSRLALGNRKVMGDLLCQSAWKGLGRRIETEQRYQPAAMSVLHTWNQKLDAHWHVHLVAPGGGPALDGSGWVRSRRPGCDATDAEGTAARADYLVDAVELRWAYRKAAIAHLKRLYRRGELKLDGEFVELQEESAWESFIGELEEVEWVSYIEPPPSEGSKPEHIVRYLSRYLSGGPISDLRIVRADDQWVTFLAREGKTPGGEEIQAEVKLPVTEFVRRWCLHIQPDQFTKTRYFGGWSNQRRESYLERCAIALESAASEGGDPPDAVDADWPPRKKDSERVERVGVKEPLVCPQCEQPLLRQTGERSKPSWREIFSAESEFCPPWYRRTLIDEERRWWDALVREGYSDWYDENIRPAVESAKEPAALPPPVQLCFAGLEPRRDFVLESF